MRWQVHELAALSFRQLGGSPPYCMIGDRRDILTPVAARPLFDQPSHLHRARPRESEHTNMQCITDWKL